MIPDEGRGEFLQNFETEEKLRMIIKTLCSF